jgi:hypothetical protein
MNSGLYHLDYFFYLSGIIINKGKLPEVDSYLLLVASCCWFDKFKSQLPDNQRQGRSTSQLC